MVLTNTPARQTNVLSRAPPSIGDGPVSRAPRFVFGSTAPSSSASQFAATPRFRFPERGGQVSDIEADTSDIAPSSSAFTEAEGRADELPYKHSRDDVIQNSNGDEAEILFQDDRTPSPLRGYLETDAYEEVFDIDAEINSIFPPTPERHKAKRRRISSPTPKDRNLDPISSCPSKSSTSPSSSPPQSPNSSFASPTTPSRQATSPGPTTPLPSSSTAFNRPPSSSTKQFRFLLYHQSNSPSLANNFTQSSQARPTTAPVPKQRRQPHFILPPNPSGPPVHRQNTQTVDQGFDIPGRPRRSTCTTTTPNFIPGGRAGSVRSWLLEAEAAKHASQFSSSQAETNINTQGRSAMQMPPPVRTSNYRLVAEVFDVQHQTSGGTSGHNMHTAGHPAPATLIITAPINNPPMSSASDNINSITNNTASRPQPAVQHPPRKILLFGTPTSTPSRNHGHRSPSNTPGYCTRFNTSSLAPTPTLAIGDKIGIRRGLVWEMEIEELGATKNSIRTNQGRIEVNEGAAGTGRGDVKMEKWVVGVEWDIL